jgi:hypothetical protein
MNQNKPHLLDEQENMQIQFDDIPHSLFVLTLMAVAGFVALPIVVLGEKTGILKKVRTSEKMCPNCKKDFPDIDTVCLRCRMVLKPKQ